MTETTIMYRTGGGSNSAEIEPTRVVNCDAFTVTAVHGDDDDQQFVTEGRHSHWCNYFDTWLEAFQFLLVTASADVATTRAAYDRACERRRAIERLRPPSQPIVGAS